MLYREAGDFKTTYKEDNQTFPIKFDRYRYYFVLIVAFLIIPFWINDYWANAIFLPFLIYSIAAIGLNILVGYCGQVSLGTGGFMAVGAYAMYKLMTAFPDVSVMIHVLLAGVITACVGVLFGCPHCGSKAFTLRLQHWLRNFFWFGYLTEFLGFIIIQPRGRSMRPSAHFLAYPSPGPMRRAGRPISFV